MTIKITDDQTAEIMGYIRCGVDIEKAMLAAGFIKNEIKAFLKKKDPDFQAQIEIAEAQFEILQIQVVVQEGGAAGARWLLEKTYPKKWGSGSGAKKKSENKPFNPGELF